MGILDFVRVGQYWQKPLCYVIKLLSIHFSRTLLPKLLVNISPKAVLVGLDCSFWWKKVTTLLENKLQGYYITIVTNSR